MPHVTPTVHTSQDPVITHVQNTSSRPLISKITRRTLQIWISSLQHSRHPSEISLHAPTARSLGLLFHVLFTHIFAELYLFVAHAFSPLALCCAAVSVVLKERRSKDSVTLAWQGPERPNGAIVEYEVIYYEKVRESTHTHTHKVQFYT